MTFNCFLGNKDNFWHKKMTFPKTENSPIWGTWSYVNSQNTSISLKPVFFFKSCYPIYRTFITHLTLLLTLLHPLSATSSPDQSHCREIAWWEIFMEQELRFGLDLGRLALLKKPFGSIMSNFWGRFFQVFVGRKIK